MRYDIMMTESKGLSNEDRYLIFQALSHPARVKILVLLAGGDLTFSSLKHELGMESSGQLQHHLQKLSVLIDDEQGGPYHLTWTGKRAVDIYRESEKTGAPLEDLCCLPAPSELAHSYRIGRVGTLLRLSIGLVLSILTASMLGNYLLTGNESMNLAIGSFYVSLWIGDAIIFGFFGVSFLVSTVTGYPGCEITAIPNLFTRSKRYCSCLMTPFNVPNGRLVQREEKSR